MTYRTTVGITVFGQPFGYSASALISEFKTFIEANSQFEIVTVTQDIQPVLSDSEFFSWDCGTGVGGTCFPSCTTCYYFPTPWSLSDTNKQKLPKDVQCNIILYDYKNIPPAFGGGMFNGDVGINNVPFIAIPLGAWPWADLPPCGGWNIAQTGALVHEWLHAIEWIFSKIGYSSFSNTDKCGDYGFTDSNDPCWTNCYKYILSLVTDPMYTALENWHKLARISPSNTTIEADTTQQFASMDTYNNDITLGTTWTKQSGSGSISDTGLYSAPSTDGSAVIRATLSGISVATSIYTNVAGCTVNMTADKASAYVGEIITFTINTQPSTQLYPVEIRDQDNNQIGICTTSGGTCQIPWDTTAMTAGTYEIQAKIGTQCESSIITVTLTDAQPASMGGGTGIIIIIGLGITALMLMKSPVKNQTN